MNIVALLSTINDLPNITINNIERLTFLLGKCQEVHAGRELLFLVDKAYVEDILIKDRSGAVPFDTSHEISKHDATYEIYEMQSHEKTTQIYGLLGKFKAKIHTRVGKYVL